MYPVVFVDAINVKIRDGNVANRPIYIALAVTVDGTREVLGLWAGEHGDGEGAKYWQRVLSEIKNRGVGDVCIMVCDGLTGLPAAIEAVWPAAISQTCVIHLLRNSFRYASRKDWAAIAADLKLVYTAVSEWAAPRQRSSCSARNGKSATRRSSSCGRTRGPSSFPFLAFHKEISRNLHDQRRRKPQLAYPQGRRRSWALPDPADRPSNASTWRS